MSTTEGEGDFLSQTVLEIPKQPYGLFRLRRLAGKRLHEAIHAKEQGNPDALTTIDVSILEPEEQTALQLAHSKLPPHQLGPNIIHLPKPPDAKRGGRKDHRRSA